MQASYPRLRDEAQRLKRAEPGYYNLVVTELRTIANELRMALVRADNTQILGIQGRCQQVDDLLRAFDPPKEK